MRFIANQIPRAGSRLTLTYRFVPSFSAGLEFNPRADKVSPLANWRALDESERRPAIIFGTSSDRIGTPSGQSYYVTASKRLVSRPGFSLAPYAGAAFGTYEHRLRGIGGVSLGLPGGFDSLLIFDGVHFHPTLSWSKGRHTVTGLLVRGHDPGVAWSVAF